MASDSNDIPKHTDPVINAADPNKTSCESSNFSKTFVNNTQEMQQSTSQIENTEENNSSQRRCETEEASTSNNNKIIYLISSVVCSECRLKLQKVCPEFLEVSFNKSHRNVLIKDEPEKMKVEDEIERNVYSDVSSSDHKLNILLQDMQKLNTALNSLKLDVNELVRDKHIKDEVIKTMHSIKKEPEDRCLNTSTNANQNEELASEIKPLYTWTNNSEVENVSDADYMNSVIFENRKLAYGTFKDANAPIAINFKEETNNGIPYKSNRFKITSPDEMLESKNMKMSALQTNYSYRSASFKREFKENDTLDRPKKFQKYSEYSEVIEYSAMKSVPFEPLNVSQFPVNNVSLEPRVLPMSGISETTSECSEMKSMSFEPTKLNQVQVKNVSLEQQILSMPGTSQTVPEYSAIKSMPFQPLNLNHFQGNNVPLEPHVLSMPGTSRTISEYSEMKSMPFEPMDLNHFQVKNVALEPQALSISGTSRTFPDCFDSEAMTNVIGGMSEKEMDRTFQSRSSSFMDNSKDSKLQNSVSPHYKEPLDKIVKDESDTGFLTTAMSKVMQFVSFGQDTQKTAYLAKAQKDRKKQINEKDIRYLKNKGDELPMQKFIKNALHESHPVLKLAPETLVEMESMMGDFVRKIGDEANNLAKVTQKRMIDSNVLNFSLKLAFETMKKEGKAGKPNSWMF